MNHRVFIEDAMVVMFNYPNYYLFNTIDDIIDRVPNTKIEEEYGQIRVENLNEVSPFWQKVLGRGYAQSIAAIGAWNFQSPKTTTKALNYFGKLFLDMQETAQSQLETHDDQQRGTLGLELTTQSHFITWQALQLCLHPRYWARTTRATTYHTDIFNDIKDLNEWPALDHMTATYRERHTFFKDYNDDRFVGQITDDMDDVLKDLSTYLRLYPEHATTNAVLTEFQYQNPDRELIELSPLDWQINDPAHDLHRAMRFVAQNNDLHFPVDLAFSHYNQRPENLSFRSLGDRPEWWAICAPVLPVTAAIGTLNKWRQHRQEPKPAPDHQKIGPT